MSSLKGKKYEDIYKDKYNEIKLKHSIGMKGKNKQFTGITLEQRYGKEKADIIKQKLSLKRLGIKFSNETRKKISIAGIGRIPPNKNKTYEELYGIEKAQQIKEKIRSVHIGKISLKKGKKLTDEQKQHLKELYKNKISPHLGKKRKKETIEKIKQKRALQKKTYLSKIEIKLQNFLKQLNIEYIPHYYIKNISLPYQCDIYVPKYNLVILLWFFPNRHWLELEYRLNLDWHWYRRYQ